MKRIFSFIVFLGVTFILCAQVAVQSRIGFSYASGTYPSEITDNVARTLENKVNQIISRNCVGATIASSAVFAIRPEIVILSQDVISTGMRGVYVSRGEITLYAVGLLDGNTYASVIIPMEGSAPNNAQSAINQMIQRINISDVRIVRFIQTAQQKIEEFFVENTPVLMQKAEILAKKGQYEDAVAVLSLIPESVSSYETVAKRMSEYYTAAIDIEAEKQMNEVEVLLVKGDTEAALDILAKIDPLSTYSPKAKETITKIHQRMLAERQAAKEQSEIVRTERALQRAEAEKKRVEDQQRQFDNQMKLEKMRLEAAIRSNGMSQGTPSSSSKSNSNSKIDSLRDVFKTINIF